jgi:hypothetical protein
LAVWGLKSRLGWQSNSSARASVLEVWGPKFRFQHYPQKRQMKSVPWVYQAIILPLE